MGKAYGVACLRRDVNRVTGEQATLGSVKMFDDQSFEGALSNPCSLFARS